MRDIKIIFGVKATYIDVHRPPTSWVCTVHGHRDIGSWPKFRGSPKPLISVVHPISRYLKFEIFDFLYENDFDANADDAGQSWGNFQFFHKKIFEMHMCGTRYEGEISKMWVFPQRSSKPEFLLLSSVFGPAQSPPQRSQRGWWQEWKFSGMLWRMKVILRFSPGGQIWYPSYISP